MRYFTFKPEALIQLGGRKYNEMLKERLDSEEDLRRQVQLDLMSQFMRSRHVVCVHSRFDRELQCHGLCVREART